MEINQLKMNCSFTIQILRQMQGSIQSTINITSAFSCKSCKQLALSPLQNQCCTIIVCQKCIEPTCHYCKKPCAYLKTPFLEHLYKCITIKCPYKCKAELTLFGLKDHLAMCPESVIQCPFCKVKNIKTSNLPQHLGGNHEEQCSRLLIEYHKKVNEPPKTESNVVKIKVFDPFIVGITGTPHISREGRLVCGADLGIAGTGGLFAQKIKCSSEGGSCCRCMRMDRQRLGLPQYCFLNLDGRICYFNPLTKKVMCGGTTLFKKACGPNFTCDPCKASLQLISHPNYRQLFAENSFIRQ